MMPSMNGSTSSSPASRSGFLLAAAGAAISGLAMVTYFLVIPRWPDLRDSGVPSTLTAAAGAALCILGLLRSFIQKRRRLGTTALSGIGILSTAFLALYIFLLSYQLPPLDGVIQVGQQAPAFELSDQDGKKRNLQEFRGRPLFLIFFRGHW